MKRQSGTTSEPLDVNVISGTITATIGGFGIPSYDYISLAQASTTDTYTFKSGGAGGSTVATVTITFVALYDNVSAPFGNGSPVKVTELVAPPYI